MKRAIVTMMVVYVSLVAIAASAHYGNGQSRCNVEISNTIDINKDVVRITNEQTGEMTVTRDHSVFVAGEQLKLNTNQQEAVAAWNSQIRTTVPGIVDLALDGVEIALTAVSEVFYGITNSEPPADLTEAMTGIREEVASSLRREDGEFYVQGDNLHGLEQVMRELEPKIEAAVLGSIGDVVMAVGRALKEENGSFEEKIAGFVSRMERVGEEVERKVSEKAVGLESRAETLCMDMVSLDEAEDQMQALIPQLKAFDLVSQHNAG